MKSWIIEKKIKIAGITLVLLSFVMNPFVVTQLFSQDKQLSFIQIAVVIASEVLLFSLGLLFWLEVSWLIKRTKIYFSTFTQRSHWELIITQVVWFILYHLVINGALWHEPGIGGQDEPSYVLFNFSSLKSILDNHRPFGLPLIVKFYGLFFSGFQFWPYFQMLFYLFSILFLYWAFLKSGINKVISLIFITFLIWDRSIPRVFPYIMSEVFSISFINITIANMLLAIRSPNWKTYTILGLSVFMAYQTRSAFAFILFLVPLWASAILLLLYRYSFSKMKRIFVSFSAITLLPFLFFCLLRLLVVGQFGVVAQAGAVLAGHAVYYLDENNIKFLSGENKEIGEELLKHKRKLDPPCNALPFMDEKVPFLKKIDMEHHCYQDYSMVAMHEAIKHITGKEPFSDPQKNIEPWQHTRTLSTFHSFNYDTRADKLLLRFTKDILFREWGQHLFWVFKSTYEGLEYIFVTRWTWICFFIILYFIKKSRFLKAARSLDKSALAIWNKQLLIIALIAVSFFVLGFLQMVIVVLSADRYIDPLFYYMFPTLFLCVLPPFWLGNTKLKENKFQGS